MAFLVLYSLSTSLLVSLSNSSFSDIYYICLYIFLYLLLSLATSNFLLPTLLSSTSLHAQLLIYYGVTELSLLSVSYILVYIIFLLLTPTLISSAICLPLILLLLSSLSSLLL